ncbi:Uncharacterised protein [Aerococcus viridans]|uniref:Uncharacterized protein n=2 Tax=Aerococcus viridans TaxID=1377 RepID=A0AAU8U362_9LACT|nr:hypothetical protein [Aerococcus viridans]AMC00345.1 hypothetical protein AWM76_01515 [Aerococcus viridans]EFG49861.1 hypothetical protein HMPREF0061_0787 [Aerococcus viridans ATCC 11563 = CCUG 4311]SUU09251.1 Uncharacterised protein [Aerococcus viridans]
MTDNQQPIYVTDPSRAKALAEYEKYVSMIPAEQVLYNQKRSKLYIDDDGNVDVDTMKELAEVKELARQDYYSKQFAIREAELEAERVEAQEFMKSYDDFLVKKNEEKAQQEIAKAKAEAEEHIEKTVRHANNLKTEDEQEKDNALKDMLKGLLG